jgi:hypothetical protein
MGGFAVADLFDEGTPQSLGGKARAEKLSPEERRQIAKGAADARWGGGDEVVRATHGSADRPLTIGAIEIPCYVLEDGRRVLVQRGLMTALDMKQGTAGRGGGDRLAKFASTKAVSPFISKELRDMITTPIRFRAGGSLAYGYEATILADLCDAILQARAGGDLHYQQAHIAKRCEILVRAFARVGIIALVDEATGYQEVRDRRALEDILNKYISEELRKWTPTFPNEYFSEIFRLKNWTAPRFPTARPGVIGTYTNDIVYSRLAPGVLDELQRLNPTDGKGRRKHKNFQFLTPDHGHPKLRDHLRDVVLLMSASSSWAEFRKLIDRVKPKVNAPGELPLSPGPSE